MPIFPNIKFINYKIPLSDSNTLLDSPRKLISLLTRKGIEIRYPGSIQNLELEIYDRIDRFFSTTENDAEVIFHLINVWGGIMAKLIYRNYDWSSIQPHYHEMIKMCHEINGTSSEEIIKAYNAVKILTSNIPGMGVAFATKHIYFWSHRNCGGCLLPIYDSTFSKNVMHYGENALLEDLIEYWGTMIKKAQVESVPIGALERQLFLYYSNNIISIKGNLFDYIDAFDIDGVIANIYSTRDALLDNYLENPTRKVSIVVNRYSDYLDYNQCKCMIYENLDKLVRNGSRRVATYPIYVLSQDGQIVSGRKMKEIYYEIVRSWYRYNKRKIDNIYYFDL